MKKNCRIAWIIFALYGVATCLLLLVGYGVQTPKVEQQEFPFSITYSYQGQTETISDVYVAEYVRKAKNLGEDPTGWYGYVKDRDRLQADFYRIAQDAGSSFSINLNLVPGYLMGDPRYAGQESSPTLVCHRDETVVTDPGELAQLGFLLVDWEYPAPVANSFSYGGISLSAEAAFCAAALAVAALLACMILVRKDPALTYGALDKVSAVLNFPVMLVAFPFILIASALSEIVADTSVWQQLLYLTPALTALGVGASVALRRSGYGKASLAVQLAGPAVFGLLLLLTDVL